MKWMPSHSLQSLLQFRTHFLSHSSFFFGKLFHVFNNLIMMVYKYLTFNGTQRHPTCCCSHLHWRSWQGGAEEWVSGAVFKAESECLGEHGRGKSGFPLLVGNIVLTVRSEHFYVQLRNRIDAQGAQYKLVCEEKLQCWWMPSASCCDTLAFQRDPVSKKRQLGRKGPSWLWTFWL